MDGEVINRYRRSRQAWRNFVGQWLRARDVETVTVDTLEVLGLAEVPAVTLMDQVSSD